MSSLPLFDQVFAGPPAPSGPPLTGDELRESGMESVFGNTPETYKQKFMEVIRNFPCGFEFTIDDVRERAGEPPIEVHRNCLGALMHNSAKKNLIVLMNETRTSERATRRAGRCAVWRRI